MVNVPYPKSLLKSACQKNIRRGYVDSAVRCARGCIELDAHDFARRVMILAPEEVSIHPFLTEMPEIITRLQKKANKVTESDIVIMLTIVRDIAAAKTRDMFEYRDKMDKIYTFDDRDRLNDFQHKMVNALWYRGSVGGLRGDTEMCKYFCDYLMYQWLDGDGYDCSVFYDTSLPPIILSSIGFPTAEDIPFVAVDFHCCPWISKLCLQKPTWIDGVRVDQPSDYLNFIEAHKHLVDEPVKSVRERDTDNDEWVKKIMWIYGGGVNTKPDFRTGETLNLAKVYGISENDQRIFEQAKDVLFPIWEDAANWYVKKCEKEAASK